jgi:hypothetical protein
MSERQIIAVGPPSQHELQLLGVGLSRAWPVDKTLCFERLLQAIDGAEREMWRDRDEKAACEVRPGSAA